MGGVINQAGSCWERTAPTQISDVSTSTINCLLESGRIRTREEVKQSVRNWKAFACGDQENDVFRDIRARRRGGTNGAEVFDELSVKISNSKKTLHLLMVLRCRPVLKCLDVLWVHLDSSLEDDVTQK